MCVSVQHFFLLLFLDSWSGKITTCTSDWLLVLFLVYYTDINWLKYIQNYWLSQTLLLILISNPQTQTDALPRPWCPYKRDNICHNITSSAELIIHQPGRMVQQFSTSQAWIIPCRILSLDAFVILDHHAILHSLVLMVFLNLHHILSYVVCLTK